VTQHAQGWYNMTQLLPRVRLESPYELTVKPTRQPHSAILLRGGAEVLQINGRGRQTVKFVGLPRPFHSNARLEIRTRIEAIACYSLKQSVIRFKRRPME